MLPGDVIGGRFELLRRAGRGGMGTVFQALDRETGMFVALKVLRDPEGHAARFLHEARVLSTIDHPHVVRYVAHAVTPRGEPYLAMEWLEGESLSVRLDRGGLPLAETLDLVRRVADALAAAHARGVVHRDIKPSNLLLPLGEAARVKVLDFGIARQSGGTVSFTGFDAIIGTLGYMAPEQARGEPDVGPPADVFALGCVLFECLAGRPAFRAEHPMALMAKLLLEEPPRLGELGLSLPQGLSELVARMLAKDPNARPADGAAVVAALSEIDIGGYDPDEAHPSGERRSITAMERRLVSIVAVARAGRITGGVVRMPEPEAARRELLYLVRQAAAPLGARVEELGSGVVVAVLVGEGSVTEQVAAAARCALSVKLALPRAAVVLVTGRAEATNRLPVGQALERAAALLDEVGEGEGPVRIDDVTRALLDPRFEVLEAEARIELHGERRRGEELRTLLGKPSPFVGRERELRNILDFVDESFEERRPLAITVTAPPGMGKSRLRQEALRKLRERYPNLAFAIARPDAIGAGSAFAMLAAALRDVLELTGGEPLEVRQEKLKRTVGLFHAGEDAQRIAEFLGEISGSPFPDRDSPRLRAARQSPQFMADQIEAAYTDLVGAIGQRQPFLLLVEDLQWGDAPSIKIIDAVLRDLQDRPVAVLAFARPEVQEIFPRLWAGRDMHTIRLASLPRRAATELVQSALGPSADAAHVAVIVERAEGNAFYLEELIRAVAEGRGEALPDTVLGMVEARLSALAPVQRRLLRAASVFGEVFWGDGVGFLLGGDEGLEGALEKLCAGELVLRRTKSRFTGEVEYAFRHALIREAAYAMLADRDRALGHGLAGEWLGRAGEMDAFVLAEHFQRGGQLEAAAAHYLRAGSQSFDRNDLEGALLRARRGIDCGAEGEVLGNLRALCAMAHCWRAELEDAHWMARAALPLVGRGSRWECIVLFHGTWASLVTGAESDFAQMADRFVRFEPDAEVRRDFMLWAPLAASLLTSYGRRELCRALLDRAEGLAAAMPSVDLDLLGALSIGHSDYVRAFERSPWRQLELTRAAVRAFEAIGDTRNQITAQNRLGQAEAELGDPDAGEETLRRAVQLAQRIQGPFSRLQSELHLAALLCKRPEDAAWGEADEIARAVLAAPGVSAGYRGWAFGIRAQILLNRGAHDEAARAAREADALCERVPLRRLWVATLLVRALIHLGQRAHALELARRMGPELSHLGGGGYVEVEARLCLAEALFASGELDDGRRALRDTAAAIELRARAIPEDAWRARYLERVPEVVRARSLLRTWQGIR
ncbi:serine/threonine-protein kinase PknK [Polyangium aurulentum]|uniref:serine/threonine-protein kinase n=1 Tax=Polyangium aurulentum TaxID=2567896 RepID=UPI001F1E14D9|nr:serine/threonine-protein kinase [Polyangium aurulentum]